jgi:hypothetical protein
MRGAGKDGLPGKLGYREGSCFVKEEMPLLGYKHAPDVLRAYPLSCVSRFYAFIVLFFVHIHVSSFCCFVVSPGLYMAEAVGRLGVHCKKACLSGREGPLR